MIAGKYKLVKKFCGEAYAAVDTSNNENVVVKLKREKYPDFVPEIDILKALDGLGWMS